MATSYYKLVGTTAVGSKPVGKRSTSWIIACRVLFFALAVID